MTPDDRLGALCAELGLLDRGTVSFVRYAHDDDCGIFGRRRACTCAPEILIEGVDRDGTPFRYRILESGELEANA